MARHKPKHGLLPGRRNGLLLFITSTRELPGCLLFTSCIPLLPLQNSPRASLYRLLFMMAGRLLPVVLLLPLLLLCSQCT